MREHRERECIDERGTDLGVPIEIEVPAERQRQVGEDARHGIGGEPFEQAPLVHRAPTHERADGHRLHVRMIGVHAQVLERVAADPSPEPFAPREHEVIEGKARQHDEREHGERPSAGEPHEPWPHDVELLFDAD